jgi:pimeloyl-ACP methyl ester carboxylesterase
MCNATCDDGRRGWRVDGKAGFILVHGSWQGAWAWEPVVARLRAAGHAARAVDLPGNGCGPEPAGPVTVAMMAGHVAQAVRDAARTSGAPVVLVGHSGGGVVVQQACELAPEGIRRAVYLCAFVARDGESILDLYAAHQKPDMRGANKRVTVSADGLRSAIAVEDAIEVFYHRAPPDMARAAAARLTPYPTVQSASRVSLSGANYGRVPRRYIETLQDRSVHLALQRAMHARMAFERVDAIDTDHAPQLSAPDELVRLLLEAAA